MTSTLCFIALGSNLDEPKLQLQRAIDTMAAWQDSRVIGVSPIYQSAPWGGVSQPDFLNRVLSMHTTKSPEALLQALQAIEKNQLRQKTVRWGPRTIDCDILLYGDNVIKTPTLEIPHPQMLARDFVCYPLLDITHDLQLPDGRAFQHCLPVRSASLQIAV